MTKPEVIMGKGSLMRWVAFLLFIAPMLTLGLAACAENDKAGTAGTPITPTPTPVGSYRIGDVATITPYADTRFSVAFLWWKESPIAVDGPYFENDYYTFTARPEMKFVILAFRFRNDWKRPLETPSLGGTVITDRGYEFPAWSPPLGVQSKEYGPRPSTQEELQALPGNAAAYEELLPEQESEQGALIFELPIDQSPTSVQLSYVDYPVLLTE